MLLVASVNYSIKNVWWWWWWQWFMATAYTSLLKTQSKEVLTKAQARCSPIAY